MKWEKDKKISELLYQGFVFFLGALLLVSGVGLFLLLSFACAKITVNLITFALKMW